MKKAISALCLFILLSVPLWARAQAVYGSIVGTVVDSSGAGLPGAKVTITDLNRSVSFTTTVPVSALPPRFGKVPSSEHAEANIVLAAISAVIMDRRDMKAFVIERSSSLNRVNYLCRHEIDC